MFEKLYRQYARQKYNKYRHKFPKMRESEIVQKMIREWDNLDSDDKQILQANYEQNHFLDDDQSKSQTTYKIKFAYKNIDISSDMICSNTQTIVKAISSHITTQIYQDDSDFNRDSANDSDDKKSDISSVVIASPKNKKISKFMNTQTTDYHQFFKQNYAQLSKQHPKWCSQQISKIVALLWQKRQRAMVAKPLRVGRKLNRVLRVVKKVTGRIQFKKQKQMQGLKTQDINSLWKKLPIQSKEVYQLKGQQHFDQLRSKNNSTNYTVTVSPFEKQTDIVEASGKYNFLHKPIK